MATLPGWGGRDRTSEWRNQNPLPYRLATPQWAGRERRGCYHDANALRPRRSIGGGGEIQPAFAKASAGRPYFALRATPGAARLLTAHPSPPKTRLIWRRTAPCCALPAIETPEVS